MKSKAKLNQFFKLELNYDKLEYFVKKYKIIILFLIYVNNKNNQHFHIDIAKSIIYNTGSTHKKEVLKVRWIYVKQQTKRHT